MSRLSDKALLKAVKNNNLAQVKWCLENKANTEATDKDGRTALHLAAWHNLPEIGLLLLNAGANIEAQMEGGATPLLDAVAFGSQSMVLLLLEKGANIFAQDENEWSMLSWALHEGHLQIARILLENAPELISVVRFNKVTPAHFLVKTKRDPHKDSVALMELLIEFGADIDCEDDMDYTPLHEAAQNGDFELARALVQRGARVLKVTQDGFVPEELAHMHHERQIESYLQEKIIHRQKRTQSTFFDINRNHHPKTPKIKNKIFNMLTTDEPTTLPSNNISGRQMVTADNAAMAQVLNGIPTDELDSAQAIIERTPFYNAGYEENGRPNANWSRERFGYQLGVDQGSRNKVPEEMAVCIQQKPVSGHLANFYMSGIGDYGDGSKNILGKIYKMTKPDPTSESDPGMEQQLAHLFLNFLKTGDPITDEMLINRGFREFSTKKERVDRILLLNRILFLTGIKEITRRMSGSNVDLPLAIAYSQGLRMIADGHLTMRDIFDKSARYGLPTVSNMQNPQMCKLAKNKLIELNRLYAKEYPQQDFTREDYHQILLNTYGGADDSDGEEYESSDEEIENSHFKMRRR